MPETGPWSYHVDGSPVYSLAAPLVDGVGTLGFDCDTLLTDLDYLA